MDTLIPYSSWILPLRFLGRCSMKLISESLNFFKIHLSLHHWQGTESTVCSCIVSSFTISLRCSVCIVRQMTQSIGCICYRYMCCSVSNQLMLTPETRAWLECEWSQKNSLELRRRLLGGATGALHRVPDAICRLLSSSTMFERKSVMRYFRITKISFKKLFNRLQDTRNDQYLWTYAFNWLVQCVMQGATCMARCQ